MRALRLALRLAAAAVLTAAISTAASAAVYPPQRQLPAQTISDFKASPNSLLQQYPTGGAQMISRVRDLGASDPTTVPGLIALLKDPATTKDQMRAIVTGLAQLARMAAQSDAAFADEIQRGIAGTNSADVIAAYQAAIGDVEIAATGGSGGGGSTGGGISQGGNNNGQGSFGSSSTPNAQGNLQPGQVGSLTSVSPR
ncbi:hypothetical protein QA640_34640 [Bradyrhizobium sp. CB82]|uniref:hypothetical protein n=1 Tax=Bradyrhizobium sp. CB82 TaxID=3039159 RepID=UPI0024B24B38|nr:hypothetical protein [Bradyrhizobium sp. CB82]WFU39460.1 hypothetical protein QA640_34640 [Bradyrhizobium sp. CB82]